jgi:hypothetical protein
MPILTRVYIKTSLIYLVAALLVGGVLALAAVVDLPVALRSLSPVYFHLLMVGWITQLIVGMLYWMLPKCSKEKPRGHDPLWWATYVLLNIGLLLRVAAEPANALTSGAAWQWGLALSALLQWLAGLTLIAAAWPRVKGR